MLPQTTNTKWYMQRIVYFSLSLVKLFFFPFVYSVIVLSTLVVNKDEYMAIAKRQFHWAGVIFKVIRLLQAFSNGIFRRVVQQMTRFNWRRASRGPPWNVCDSWASCLVTSKKCRLIWLPTVDDRSCDILRNSKQCQERSCVELI